MRPLRADEWRRLKRARELVRRGKTRAQAAAAIGLSRAQLWRWERLAARDEQTGGAP